MSCKEIRENIATGAGSSQVAEHVAECVECAAYQRRNVALDVTLQAELFHFAPARLTEQLLAFAANPDAARPEPRKWYVNLVAFLTAAALMVSMLVSWELGNLLLQQLGLADMFNRIAAIPGDLLRQVTTAVPQTSYALSIFQVVRDTALWLLCAAVIWMTASKWRTERMLEA
jgi:anti-sigma factor RsiW